MRHHTKHEIPLPVRRLCADQIVRLIWLAVVILGLTLFAEPARAA